MRPSPYVMDGLVNDGGSPAADLVLRQRLRPFLNHPGVRFSESFYKPWQPDCRGIHTLQASLSDSRLLRPFTSFTADSVERPRPKPVFEEKRKLIRPYGRAVVFAEDLCYASDYEPPYHYEPPQEFRDPFSDGDPDQINFSEEPDDYRVLVPAHRIGDTPELSPPRPQRNFLQEQQFRPRPAGALGGSCIVSGKCGRLLVGVAQNHLTRARGEARKPNAKPQLFLAAKGISAPRAPSRGGALGCGISPEEQAALARLFDDCGGEEALLER